jgi:ABC-type oligopeptide transport system substrate-binding subunit/ABC-type branched-subunit amino acid transport system substrate-binding protein
MIPEKSFFIFLIIVITCASCDIATKSKELRTKKALEPGNEFVIAAVGSVQKKNFLLEGIQLAAKQINTRKSFMGRSLRVVSYDMGHSIANAKKIACKIAKNSNIRAVIGYPYSSAAIPTSITFEQGGILFISTGATHDAFTQKGGQFTFRNIPSNKYIAHEIALFAKRNKYNNLILFIDLDCYKQDLANFFSEEAIKNGLKIVDQKTYFGWQNNFRNKLADLQNKQSFDAIFLNGDFPAAAEIIKQARQMGIKQKFIGNFSIDSQELWEIAGKHSNNTIVPTVFNPKSTSSQNIKFVKNFQDEYGVLPDTWAALGYDAVHALEMAVRKSTSLNPIDIASSLRLIDDFNGVTGKFLFSKDSKQSDEHLFFKIANENNYVFLEEGLHSKINLNDVVEDITLRLPMNADFSTLDPGLVIDQNSVEITEQLFLGLTDFSRDKYEPVPELAKKWIVGADGINYTFVLRDDVLWTDGKRVTAYDIEWAIQRNNDPKTNAPNTFLLHILKNAKKVCQGEIKDKDDIGVNVIDKFKIRFTLEHPAAYFPSLAGLPIFRPLPRHIIEKYGNRWTDVDKIVSNGSYKIVAWDKGKVVILRKNPDYFESKKVSIPEVRYHIISDSSLGLLLYQSNEIDIIGSCFLNLPSSKLVDIQLNPEMHNQYKEVLLFLFHSFLFNTLNPPLDNVTVRKAIVAAIDRELIIKMVVGGSFEMGKTITVPQSPEEKNFFSDIGIQFSPSNAKKWLSEAGYPEGKGFPEIHLITNKSPINNALAGAIKDCLLYYANINVVVKSLSFDEYYSVFSDPGSINWHMMRLGYVADYPDPNNWLNDLFNPSNRNNIVGWKNNEYENIIESASRELNPNKRKSLFKRAEKILCNEKCVVSPLFYEKGIFLVNTRVKNWYNMAIGGQHIRNWSLGERN